MLIFVTFRKCLGTVLSISRKYIPMLRCPNKEIFSCQSIHERIFISKCKYHALQGFSCHEQWKIPLQTFYCHELQSVITVRKSCITGFSSSRSRLILCYCRNLSRLHHQCQKDRKIILMVLNIGSQDIVKFIRPIVRICNSIPCRPACPFKIN